MEKQLSGLQLFLHYILPCLEGKLLKNLMLIEDYDRFIFHIQDKTDPSPEFLEQHFPDAVRSYRETCGRESVEANFSFASVAKHWRYNHGHEGNCAVKIATVLSVTGVRVSVISDGKTFDVVNFFGLPLKPETMPTVSTHLGAVIEIIE